MQLLVQSVDATHVWVDYNEPDDLTIPIGSTLVAITRPASVFSDPYAQLPLNNSQVTVDSSGRAAFFLRDSRADAIVTGTGFSTRIYPFLAGGYRAGNSSWLNAMDFPSIQAAVDALPLRSGGTVFIPAGAYGPHSAPSFRPPLVLPHDRPVRVVGEGMELTTLMYRFVDAPDSFDPSLDLIQVTGHHQTIEDLSLVGSTSPLAVGYGSGIRIWRTHDVPNDEGLIFGAQVHRVAIRNVPGYGIKVDDGSRNGVIQCAVWTTYYDLLIQGCTLGGVYLGARTTTQFFRSCNFRSMGGSVPPNPSVLVDGTSGVSFWDCIFDDLKGTAIQLNDANNILIDHGWFEGRPWPGVPCISASGTYDGLSIRACIFQQIWDNEPIARNDMLAVRVDGIGKSVSINDAWIWLPVGDASLGTHPHILVLAPASGAPPCEVTITGGSLRDGTASQDATHRTMRIAGPVAQRSMLGASWRSKLTAISESQRSGLAAINDWSAGDIIFNTDTSKAQVFDGSTWRDLYEVAGRATCDSSSPRLAEASPSQQSPQ